MGIYVNPGNEEFKRAVNSKIYRQDNASCFHKPEFKIGASEHLRQPSPPFRKIHGGKYAGGILWKRG